MSDIVNRLLNEGQGIFRLAPAWVPRSFCRPGRRIKLHQDDYFVLGLTRGGIDERWFASTTRAENGPGTPEDEGLSYIVSADGKERALLRDAVDHLKGQAIGASLWEKYGGWPIYSKLFDNLNPLPHHVHHDDEAAARVGQKGKHEMYFYPSQLNNHGGEFPYTFFGFNPGVTKEQVKKTLMNFSKGDNQITNLSRAYKLTLDTGFDVPPGILHAPGSLCTYEPQFASDVYAMYQSVLHGDHVVPEELLWKDTPPEEVGNYDYLIDILDWERNVDPDFYQRFFMAPKPVRPLEEMQAEGYVEEWICYKSKKVSAKRLTVFPGRAVTIRDNAAYGLYMLQGHGKLGSWDIETPSSIRYGQLTNDEFFVTEPSAREGVTIVNPSSSDPIVMLKHFAENPDLPE
jgi:Phosphomannose isomerase